MNSQEFNGEYTSNKTSFKDEGNESNNFTEQTQYNIAIHIQENTGYVTIQDPRTPNNPLIYKITKRESGIENERVKLFIYQALREDVESKENSQLTLYVKDKHLNLMVSNSESSQMFHRLSNKPIRTKSDEDILKEVDELLQLDANNRFYEFSKNNTISGEKKYTDDYLTIYDDYEDLEKLKELQAQRQASFWKKVISWTVLSIIATLLIIKVILVLKKRNYDK